MVNEGKYTSPMDPVGKKIYSLVKKHDWKMENCIFIFGGIHRSSFHGSCLFMVVFVGVPYGPSLRPVFFCANIIGCLGVDSDWDPPYESGIGIGIVT